MVRNVSSPHVHAARSKLLRFHSSSHFFAACAWWLHHERKPEGVCMTMMMSAMFNPTTMKMIIKVRIRNIKPSAEGKHEPYVTIQIHPKGLEKPPSLTVVKDKVIKELQSSWDNKGVNLTADNIKVFLVCGSTAKEVGEDLQPLKSEQDTAQGEGTTHVHNDQTNKKVFVAMEYFTQVPEDLFRTALNSQLGKVTFAHPGHANTSWTNVSPLYCAGFGRSEYELPWHGVDRNGNFQVHGVSIRCRDDSETAVEADAAVDPFADIAVDEKKGVLKATIGQCKKSVNYTEFNEEKGFLESNVTMFDVVSSYRKEDRINMDKIGGAKVKQLAEKRVPYFRFKLKQGLDLSKYGVAVIYDNRSPLHYTLVRTGDPLGSRRWAEHGRMKIYVHEEFIRDTKDNVLGDIFTLYDGKEPESFGDGKFRYLPKVAALFALDDMKLEASAEPVPPQLILDDDESVDRHKIYEGALVLYHVVLDWNVVLSIEALEEAKYVVNDLDQWSRDTLLEALTTWNTRNNVDIDVVVEVLKGGEEWDASRAMAALSYIEDALISVSSEENSASTSKQLPPSPPAATVLGNFIKATSTPQGQSGDGKSKSPDKSESTSGTPAAIEPPAATEPSASRKDPSTLNALEAELDKTMARQMILAIDRTSSAGFNVWLWI